MCLSQISCRLFVPYPVSFYSLKHNDLLAVRYLYSLTCTVRPVILTLRNLWALDQTSNLLNVPWESVTRCFGVFFATGGKYWEISLALSGLWTCFEICACVCGLKSSPAGAGCAPFSSLTYCRSEKLKVEEAALKGL